MSDDPLKRAMALLEEAVITLRSVGIPVPRPESQKHSNAKKFTKREVEHMRGLKRTGMSQREIADVYDCNAATISRIVRGQYHR